MLNHAYTAENALTVLQTLAPQATECVAPHLHRLFAALADGHTFVYVSKNDAKLLSQAQPIVGLGNSHAPLILHQNRLFLGKFWQLEQQLAQEIQRLDYPHKLPENAAFLQQKLRDWFPDSGSQDQQAAAALTLLQNVMLIGGGPGTGKTTTVAKLLALLCHNDTLPRIALAAPTGKAAARMSEALKNAVERIDGLPEHIAAHLRQLNGQTVHRLLELKPPQMLPEYDSDNRLPLDILIVDEASMLDIYLLRQLLQALPTSCRVILLGDENQLPSVSAGAVLSAWVQSSDVLPENTQRDLRQLLTHQPQHLRQRTAKLTISHRFGADSGIGCLARAVVLGDADAAWAQFARFPEVLRHHENDIGDIAKQLYRAHANYWQAIENGDLPQAFARQNDVVVLTAHRADAAALDAAYLQQLYQHRRAHSGSPWFAGQMLMITRNDPATRLYNGDVGIVLPHDYGLVAWFPDTASTFRPIALSRLPEHENAFAMTVHKSQGSEYREVWFVPPTLQDDEGYSRALLYTAITRAKEKFAYCGAKNGFQAACNTPDQRRSALGEWLRQTQGDLFV